MLLGDIESRGYRTFADAIDALERSDVDYAVLPHENSLHGPIEAVRDLLASRSEVHVVGEAEMPIQQCLIAMPGATLESIDTVASHPVALTQCRRFLQQRSGWRVVAADDTAGAVREMMEHGRMRTAAIGPALAAERYGACLLLANIQDDSLNVTKFWLIARTE